MNRLGAGVTEIGSGIAFANSGVINVNAGTFDVAEPYVQTGGASVLAPGAILKSNGGVHNQGGVLRGAGTVIANITNNALVEPGTVGGAGTLTVTGDYTQTAGGTLNIEIGGTSTSQRDRLLVSGAATLEGTLNVTLINAFAPTLGDSFQVLTFASRIGDFATMNGLNLGGGLELDPVYSSTSLTLVTVNA
jgi:hypothetical protein